ncbi:hypothetical protein QLX08_004871 [Tetragonisca angustula]|uniref:Uncharacterized protein n=1 Tax=Tetragonisca angustula TaxID=166442 RepID=A0AAW1A0S3_9HYME
MAPCPRDRCPVARFLTYACQDTEPLDTRGNPTYVTNVAGPGSVRVCMHAYTTMQKNMQRRTSGGKQASQACKLEKEVGPRDPGGSRGCCGITAPRICMLRTE